jgi:hypothetical protein
MSRGRLLWLGVPLLALALNLPGAVAAFPSQEGGTGLWDVRSARVPVPGTLSVRLGGTAYRIGADLVAGDPADRDLVDGGLQIGWIPIERLEVWGNVNAAVSRYDGETVFSARDSRIGAKYGLADGRRFRAALLGHLNLPVGNRTRGFSTDAIDPNLTAAITLPLPDSNTITSAFVHVNLGYQWHLDDRGRAYEGWPPYYLEPVYPGGDKDRLDLRTAIEFRGEKATLFVELLLDRVLNGDVAFREGPIFLTPGFRYAFAETWSMAIASKITLASDDPSTTRYRPPDEMFPNWQLGFALTWSMDGRNVDRDEDGVPDWKDACPRDPEDLDGWQDDDGCPDPDNDGDGIADRYDGAMNEAEDIDGFADTDGIPDPDNDGDGVPDVIDVCPDVAEDRDGIADGDGCPEIDADGDGIRDTIDKCPEEAETIDGIDDEDGCPDNVGMGDPYLLHGVEWEGTKVEPKPGSYLDLNRLAEAMRQDPAQLVELRVHSPGADRARAEQLALLRAEFLKAFLVTAGVEPHRVLATGDADASIFDSPFHGAERVDRPRVEVLPKVGRGVAGNAH